MAEIIEEIGLPKDVFNMITADRAASEVLVRHPDVDKVAFTGASAIGKRIASICGERVARYTLELGGKSAAAVLDDYDVGQAAQHLAMVTPVMSGQVCAALTRVIVPRNRNDQLVAELSSALLALKVGDPFDQTTGMGPLRMSRARDRVESYIAKARSEGAIFAAGEIERANVSTSVTNAQLV